MSNSKKKRLARIEKKLDDATATEKILGWLDQDQKTGEVIFTSGCKKLKITRWEKRENETAEQTRKRAIHQLEDQNKEILIIMFDYTLFP